MGTNYIDEAMSILREELAKVGKGNQETAFEHGYLLLVLTKGLLTTLEDVHDVWAIVRSVNRPGHQDLVPFDRLAPGVADYDEPFRFAIHATRVRLDAALVRTEDWNA